MANSELFLISMKMTILKNQTIISGNNNYSIKIKKNILI